MNLSHWNTAERDESSCEREIADDEQETDVIHDDEDMIPRDFKSKAIVIPLAYTCLILINIYIHIYILLVPWKDKTEQYYNSYVEIIYNK